MRAAAAMEKLNVIKGFSENKQDGVRYDIDLHNACMRGLRMLDIVEKHDPRIKEIVQAYGYDAQSRQAIEELAELTQAINKFWRKDLKCGRETLKQDEINRKSEYYKNLIEELADVEIMMAQMKEMLACDDEVAELIEEKIKRQIERLKER